MRHLPHTRLRPAAVLLAAAALTPTAPAAFAAVPKPPTLQQASFRLTFTGTQTTTWNRAPQTTFRDCTPTVLASGHGKETVRVRTAKTMVLNAVRSNGRTAIGLRPSKGGVVDDLPARISRSATERFEEVASACAVNPGRVTDGGPYDCGSRDRDLAVVLRYRNGRVTPGFDESLLHPLRKITFDRCPIHAATGVEVNGFTAVGAALPARDIFDRRIGKHIVLGRRTFTLAEPGYTGTTTVRWELTLVRMKG